MGAKYLPTIKDQKASQRFQRNQKAATKPSQKPNPVPATKPKKK
jgi:hypothetical protein